MKALVGTYNQEKALVGAFSMIVKLNRLIDLRHYSSLSVLPRMIQRTMVLPRMEVTRIREKQKVHTI